MEGRVAEEAYPGAETCSQPVEPDVLDGGDVVEGLGEGGMASSVSGWLGESTSYSNYRILGVNYEVAMHRRR